MADPPLIEIREWGRPARRRTLTQPIDVGRECDGEVLDDASISRRHLRLVPTPTSFSVVDLGSRNGTTINGTTLTGRGTLQAGDVVRIGRSEIIVLSTPTGAKPDDDHDATHLTVQLRLPVAAPPPSALPPPPRGVVVASWLLGIDDRGTDDPFRAYTELPSRIPLSVWRVARVISIASFAALAAALFVRPAGGLFVLFEVIVPLLPLVFLIAPGLWRNVCPLAASNQIPRVLGFSRGWNPPELLYSRGYLVAVALFFGVAGSRLAGLDRNATATGTVLVVVIAAAFAGGVAFKGKSGWCSSICPLFPVQRAYGQTPFVTVPNSHCRPCVGCAKNCYDFKPGVGHQADLVDIDRSWSAPRKLFAAALPGFVIGFFTLTGELERPLLERYAVLSLFVLVAVGSYFALEALTPLSPAVLTAAYPAIALNAFYWFAAPVLSASLAEITGVTLPWLRWVISAVVLAATVIWLARTRVRELQFAVALGARTKPVVLPFPRRPVNEQPAESGVSVCFEPGATTVAIDASTSLLEAAEKAGLPIEAGCRMGVCGADPVAVVSGMTNLSTPRPDEINTLQRLGLAANTRMACCARVERGAVTASLNPEPGDRGALHPAHYDRSIVSVVVIGTGIAGVTAADFVRRGHPECEIHLIGREPHSLYNRMGISRLVYGRSAMQGLALLSEQWYEDHDVTLWLNTVATEIDVRGRRAILGTGEVVPYDRLILAMGAAAATPPIDGLNRPGSFVLREAADAMQIRAYAQQHGSRTAVVAGGGLLGLEAAVALNELGLRVTVLERAARLLHRQVDTRCSELLGEHVLRLGIDVLYGSETTEVTGDPAVNAVRLRDGRTIACGLFLTATGIRPNVDLARDAGIPVGHGVLVDDRMQTRVPGVFAAGDVAEHDGRVHGLWPIAAEQARAAAINCLGGDVVVVAETPATILKGVGLELFATGRAEPEDGDDVIVVDRPDERSYRRLVVGDGRAVGAVILGHHPADQVAVQVAVGHQLEIPSSVRDRLRSGDWSTLHDLAAGVAD